MVELFSKKIKFLIFLILFFFPFSFLKAEEINHVLISEIKISGLTADDEFIELYNPTSLPINLTGYTLKKKNSNGNESTLLTSSRFNGKIIQPKSFLLLAREEKYQGLIQPDIFWPSSYNLASDNTIILYDASGTIIDKVGWGQAKDYETNPFPQNPNDNQSLERKASFYSSASTLALNGIEEKSGNSFDSDNNAFDFVLQDYPNPQNSDFFENEPPLNGPITQNQVCGNGIREGDEECDGFDLNGKTCTSFGFSGGNLICNQSCKYDTTYCFSTNKNSSTNSYQIKPSDIVINEIYPQPDYRKGEEEWIELYNRTDKVLNLDNFSIEDNTSKPRFLSNITITAHGYYVLKKNKDFNFSLNNSGDIIVLKFNELIIDQVTYGDFEDGYLLDNAKSPGLGESIGRNSSSQDTNNDRNDFFIYQKPTPGFQNDEEFKEKDEVNKEIESNEVRENTEIKNIFINEFLPNPIGEDRGNEWIEIYNDNEFDVDLSNWQLDDSEGGSLPYKFPIGFKIKAKEYLVLTSDKTKIVLNNNIDSVRLIKPDNSLYQKVDYLNPPEGASYALKEFNEWYYTTSLTPGSQNKFEVIEFDDNEIIENKNNENKNNKEKEEEELEISLEDLPYLDGGEKIKIKGVVVAPPNLFAKTYFYLNGIQVYSSYGKFPKLDIGDLVEVEGIFSKALNHKRIKIKNENQIKILLKNQPVFSKKINLADLNENLIDSLIEVAGEIVEKSGSKFYLSDGEDEIVVSLPPKVDKNLIKEGQNLIVKGILIEGKNGYQILPRFQKDLIIKEEGPKGNIEKDQENLKIFKESNLNSSLANFWLKPLFLKYLVINLFVLITILICLLLKFKKII
jgi:hypothetical protein